MILVTWLFRNYVRDANRRIRTAIARINSFLQEHISGMSVVQLFNREQKSRAQFAELNRIHMEAYKDAIGASLFFYPGCRISQHGRHHPCCSGLAACARSPGRVPVGVLIAFMQYAQRFFQPIQDLSEKFNILQSAMAASERIFSLLDEPITLLPLTR